MDDGDDAGHCNDRVHISQEASVAVVPQPTTLDWLHNNHYSLGGPYYRVGLPVVLWKRKPI